MKRTYHRIGIAVLIFTVIISVFLFVVLYLPYNKELEAEKVDNFSLVAHNKQFMFEEYLNDYIYITTSLSKEIAMRDMLSEYLNDSISLEEVKDFTSPIFANNFFRDDNIHYIKRVTLDGDTIYSNGIDSANIGVINWNLTEVSSEYDSKNESLFIQSPIIKEDKVIAYDIVIVDASPIIEELEEDLYSLSFTKNITEDKVFRENGMLTSYIYCYPIDNNMIISIDESIVFKDVNILSARSAIIYFVGLVIVFMIIQYIIYYYVKKDIKTQRQLKISAEELVQEMDLLIDNMTKGFVVVDASKSDKDKYNPYRIIYANDSFKDMVGKSKEEIAGMSFFEVINLKEEQNTEFIINALLGFESGKQQVECYMDGLDRWWILSAYSHKENKVAIICDDITDNKMTTEQLKYNEETLRVIFDVSGEGIWDFCIGDGVVSHNKKWCDILGFGGEKMYHTKDDFISMVHPEDRDEVINLMDKSIKEQVDYESHHRMIKSDGSTVWIVDRGTILSDKYGKPLRMLGSTSDVTEQKIAEKELLKEKETLHATLLSLRDGIIATDNNGYITLINHSAEIMTGYTKDEAIGKDFNEVFRLISTKTKTQTKKCKFDYFKENLIKNDNNVKENEKILLTSNGDEIRISKKISPIILSENETIGFVIAFRDITAKYNNQKKLEYLSLHDELTGLYNKRVMEDVINKLDTDRNYPLTVMVLDLNNLKLTNDVFGHAKGDDLVQRAAQFLTRTFRAEDFIARTGGDEFCVILPKTSEEIAKKIKEKVQNESPDQMLGVVGFSFAVGYSVKTNKDELIEDILRQADSGMYRDKQKSRKRYKDILLAGYQERNYEEIISEEDHTYGVSKFAASLYEALGKREDEVSTFRQAVELHDIGKVAIPTEILNKKEELTDRDIVIIKEHSRASYQILRILHLYEEFAESILYHHERIDGTGYPLGLEGDSIPLESKVIAIADAYESMISGRVYKEVLNKEDAIQELRINSGTQFDSELVELFIEKVLKA